VKEELSEKEVIARVLGGAHEEFRHLVIANQNKIYSMIMRQVGDPELAKELTQDAFMRAYKGLGSFRTEAAFSTWLVRIALNVTNSYFSSRRFKEARRTQGLDWELQSQPQTDSQEAGEEEIRAKKLRLVVAELPEHYRDALILCAFEERSYEEASDILGIPMGTVRSRVHRARALVRERYFEA